MQTLLPDRVGTMSPNGVAEAHNWPLDGVWLRAVMLATADGAAVSPTGRSGGISSAGDRLLFGTIRGMADVILVGAQTIRQEGYSPMKPRRELEARRVEAEQDPVPRLAIVSRSGDLNTASPLFTDSADPPVVFLPQAVADDQRDRLSQVAEVVVLGSASVPLDQAVAHLETLGLKRIVCEGGPTLLGELASHGLVDELCLTITPLLSGGSYSQDHAVPRILDGTVLLDSPKELHLVHVLEDSGTLFLRYVLAGPT